VPVWAAAERGMRACALGTTGSNHDQATAATCAPPNNLLTSLAAFGALNR
jgi:hypothetical protein